MSILPRCMRFALLLCLLGGGLYSATWGMDTWGDGSLVSLGTTPVIVVAGPVIVQQSSVEGSAVTSIRASFPSPNVRGGLIIAFVRMSTTSQTVSLSDSAGNTYTRAVRQTQAADGSQAHIYYAIAKGGANAVTAKFSGANGHPWLAIYECSGVTTLDRIASAQGVSAAPKVSIATNRLLFVGVGLPSSFTGTASAGSGFTFKLQDTGHSRAATETLIPKSPATTAGFTLSRTGNWAIVAASFK